MCGIVGRINFNCKPVDTDVLKKSIDIIKERGPDDYGVWQENGCGLAHRRLSILDLSSAGHQPMLSSNGRYSCVYNGEIYNFLDLRKKLENEGLSWKGHSDTEVLLEGWSQWGVQLLEK